jgi:hypothetical protein
LSVLLGCGALHLWTTHVRLARLEAISALAQWSVGPTVIDANTPTGYADGRRAWLAPGRSEEAFPWILETQLLVTGGDWRGRRVDHENAPIGRSNHSPLLYRLWLGSVAWADHLLNGSSLPLAAERAARWADPALSLLFLIFGGIWIGRTWGGRAACVAGIGWIGLFPLGTAFLPGAPDPGGLAWVCLATCLLGLVAAHRAGDQPAPDLGLVGGGGGWVCVRTRAGAAGRPAPAPARWSTRGSSDAAARPRMRPWMRAAGAFSCVARRLPGLLVLENLPARRRRWEDGCTCMPWPAGLGELLARLIPWIQTGRRPARDSAAIFAGVIAFGLIALAPVYHYSQSISFAGALDPLAGRLSPLSDLVAGSWGEGLAQEGARRIFLAVLLPWGAAALAVGIWILRVRRGRDPGPGLLALGAALPLLALTWIHLSAFASAGAGLCVLATVLFARQEHLPPAPLNLDWLPPVIVGLAVFPGLVLQWPPRGAPGRPSLDRGDEVVVNATRVLAGKAGGKREPAITASPAARRASFTEAARRRLSPERGGPAPRPHARPPRRMKPGAAASAAGPLCGAVGTGFGEFGARRHTGRRCSSSARCAAGFPDLAATLPYRLPKIGGFEQESVVAGGRRRAGEPLP